MLANDVLIEPRRLPGDPLIDHPIIFNLFEPYMEFLRQELKVKKSELKKNRFPSTVYLTTKVGRKKISVFGTPLGAPHAVIMLERLIAMGAQKIFALGCCGSLQTYLSIGSFVIPLSALSEEGTSAHYPLPQGAVAAADAQIVNICLTKCAEKKIKPVSGKVWTTDALFRETREKVKKYSQSNLLAVEMEMSALFTVAAYRHVQLAGIMVVSDELATLKWKTGFLNPLFWMNSKKAAQVAIETCLALA
ncbi:MAG: nucleoside phosphorylase [Thermodesulfobacteriota bacterium]